MKTLALLALCALSTFAQVTKTAKVVEVPPKDALPIVEQIKQFYLLKNQFAEQAAQQIAFRDKTLNDLKAKILEMQKVIEKEHDCNFDLDSSICTAKEKN